MDLKQLAEDLSIEDLEIFVEEHKNKRMKKVMQLCEDLFNAYPDYDSIVLGIVYKCYDGSCCPIPCSEVLEFEPNVEAGLNDLEDNPILKEIDKYYDLDFSKAEDIYPGEEIAFYVEKKTDNTFVLNSVVWEHYVE